MGENLSPFLNKFQVYKIKTMKALIIIFILSLSACVSPRQTSSIYNQTALGDSVSTIILNNKAKDIKKILKKKVLNDYNKAKQKTAVVVTQKANTFITKNTTGTIIKLIK